MARFMVIRTTLGIGALMLLGGCAGGGEETPPPAAVASPVGVWVGSSSNGRNVVGAVMEDGSYTFVHTTNRQVSGGTIGTYELTPSGFTGSDLRDFSIDDADRFDGSVTGTYQEGQWLSAAMMLNNGGGASVYLRPVNTRNDVSDLALVAGVYGGFDTGSVRWGSWFEIAVDGTLTFHGPMANADPFWLVGHCADKTIGRLTPKQRGHVYDLTITDTCSPSGEVKTYRGVVVYLAEVQRLVFLAVDRDRATGLVYNGFKCLNLELARIGGCSLPPSL